LYGNSQLHRHQTLTFMPYMVMTMPAKNSLVLTSQLPLLKMVSPEQQAIMFAPSSQKPSRFPYAQSQQRPVLLNEMVQEDSNKDTPRTASPSWSQGHSQSEKIRATYDLVQQSPDTQSCPNPLYSNYYKSSDRHVTPYAHMPRLKRSTDTTYRALSITGSSNMIVTTRQASKSLPRQDSIVEETRDSELVPGEVDGWSSDPTILNLPPGAPPAGKQEHQELYFGDCPADHAETYNSSVSPLDLDNLRSVSQSRKNAQVVSGELRERRYPTALGRTEASARHFHASRSTTILGDRVEKTFGAAGSQVKQTHSGLPALRRLSLGLPTGLSLLQEFNSALRQRESSTIQLEAKMRTTTANAEDSLDKYMEYMEYMKWTEGK
jgi:hypothetical protein